LFNKINNLLLLFAKLKSLTVMTPFIFKKVTACCAKISLTLFLLLYAGITFSQSYAGFSAENALRHIGYLASDQLRGRKAGSQEGLIAAQYIRDHFKQLGMTLPGDNGLQPFEVITGISLDEGNFLTIGDHSLTPGEDYTPLPFSISADLSANLVFVGYGFDLTSDTLTWNDFGGVDLKGKWAVILRGTLTSSSGKELIPANADERFKVMIAQDHGAAGVIFVSGTMTDQSDNLLKLSYDKSPATATIPVVQIKREFLDGQLAPLHLRIEDLEKEISDNKKPKSMEWPITVTASVKLSKVRSTAYNVVGIIEGSDPELRRQSVIIGAHFDHLGTGGYGSGSRVPDTMAIHYGADDNASGVSGILLLAEYFSRPEHRPARTLVFVAFDAEEIGLIGSRFFAENPLTDLKNTYVMVNFDMIGRLKETNTLSVGGTGTAVEFDSLLNQLANRHPLALSRSPEGFGPSDHASFYAKNIPVLFISTGAHADYHTPRDNVAGINAEGMTTVLDFSADLITALAGSNEKLTFTEAGPSSRASHRYNFKVTLGIMPDMTSAGNDGLRVEAVRPGAPASGGGMLKGDIITAIDGNPVGNIYDYMGRLKNLNPGQIITVDVMRNGQHEVLLIHL